MRLKQMLKNRVASLALALFSGMAWAADDTNGVALLKSMSLEDLGNIQVNTVDAASKV